MTRKFATAFFSGFLFLLGPSLAFAHHPKLAPDLERRNPNSIVDVIVQFRSVPGPAHHQRVAARGGSLKANLPVVKAGLYSVPAGRLEDLANDPAVVHISPDRPVRAMLNYTVPAVNANMAWKYGWIGTGIAVAVIDSGVSDNPDMHSLVGNRVVYGQSFVNGSDVDQYGHGTHVMGIVAGGGGQSLGLYTGIAPNANIVNLRVLDKTGSGTDSSVIAGIQAAVQLKSKYNIRVINLSLGRPVFESYTVDPLCQAVEAAWKAGIVVVVAAGNNGRDNSFGEDGYGTIGAPANDPYVITVGAMKTEGTLQRSDDLIASYSSKGPTPIDHIVKPDLVAPGNKVVSLLGGGNTLANEAPGNTVPPNYFRLSGTSMAAPVVSGAAALLLQANPQLTPDQIKARLMKTASKQFPASSIATDPVTGQQYTSYYDIFTVGAGYLDIAAAFANTDLVSGSALSPTAVYNSATNTITLVGTDQVVWGSQVVWGDQVVWGNQVVWGDQVVWGNQVVWGDQVVWGSSSPWSTSTPASESFTIAVNGEN